ETIEKRLKCWSAQQDRVCQVASCFRIALSILLFFRIKPITGNDDTLLLGCAIHIKIPQQTILLVIEETDQISPWVTRARKKLRSRIDLTTGASKDGFLENGGSQKSEKRFRQSQSQLFSGNHKRFYLSYPWHEITKRLAFF